MDGWTSYFSSLLLFWLDSTNLFPKLIGNIMTRWYFWHKYSFATCRSFGDIYTVTRVINMVDCGVAVTNGGNPLSSRFPLALMRPGITFLTKSYKFRYEWAGQGYFDCGLSFRTVFERANNLHFQLHKAFKARYYLD